MNSENAARKRIYLDNNATTPVSVAALEAMLPFLTENFGNPSSLHLSGQVARDAVEGARGRMAGILGFRPAELVFTSGVTESINQAVRGALEAFPGRKRLVISAVEHSATMDICERLTASGLEVVTLGVDPDGTLPPERVEAALDSDTAVLSLLWVNNETGVRFDVLKIGEVARRRGVMFHVDAAQIVGKGLTDLRDAPIDMLSFGAHKFGGPKGVGGLWIARTGRVRPLIWGGHHEKARRGGTENVPGIVGMAAALGDSERAWKERRAEVGRLRDRLAAGLRQGVPDLLENGLDAPRLENTLNVCFRNIEGAAIVLRLSAMGLDCSSGSACTASQSGPSHVLVAMGVPGDYVHGSVRFSLSTRTTESEIDVAIREIVAAVAHVSRVNLV